MKNQILQINKSNLFQTRIHESNVEELKDGEILLKINKFALTTNNITYAVTGVQLNYWGFFPAHEEEWGIIPCWGFAEVTESKAEGVNIGEKIYGYFPMADYLKIEAGNINGHSISDVAAHRQPMAAIYNTYNRLGMDIKYPSSIQDYMPIFQPLFATSFLNYEFLKSEDFFGANRVLITSASSKTGLGLAFMLHSNKRIDQKKIIGLTSSKNVDFVKSTGFYDEILSYDVLPQQLEQTPTIVVDMAGNAALLSSIYAHLNEQLKFISKIGLTDWTAASMEDKIPVAKFFFAPTFAGIFFKKHGAKDANKIIVKKMFSFIENAQNWISIEELGSLDELEKIYLKILKGEVDPKKGYLMMLNK
jgi:hypothetical protein